MNLHCKYIFIILVLNSFIPVFSQDGSCYAPTRSAGITAYNAGDMKKARSYFDAAQKCPDAPQNGDISEWIDRCNSHFKEQEVFEESCIKNTLDAYKKYIEKYPKGKYIKDVSERLGVLYFNLGKASQEKEDYDKAIAHFKESDKYGNIYAKEAIISILKTKYDVSKFNDSGVGIAKSNEKYGFVNRLGDWIINPLYAVIAEDTVGIYKVALDGKYGENDRKWGLVDAKGSIILRPSYDVIALYKEGMAGVVLNKKCGFIDLKGALIIPPEYDDCRLFYEGLAAVMKNSSWGYVDKKGNVIIPIEYNQVGFFSEGLAWVEKDGRLGYINNKNKIVIPFQYINTTPFINGKAKVRIKPEEDLYIDRKGKIIKK